MSKRYTYQIYAGFQFDREPLKPISKVCKSLREAQEHYRQIVETRGGFTIYNIKRSDGKWINTKE